MIVCCAMLPNKEIMNKTDRHPGDYYGFCWESGK